MKCDSVCSRSVVWYHLHMLERITQNTYAHIWQYMAQTHPLTHRVPPSLTLSQHFEGNKFYGTLKEPQRQFQIQNVVSHTIKLAQFCSFLSFLSTEEHWVTLKSFCLNMVALWQLWSSYVFLEQTALLSPWFFLSLLTELCVKQGSKTRGKKIVLICS